MIYESAEGIRYPIRRVIVDVECRVEKVKPKFDEHIYNRKYVALAKARFKDAPVNLSVAVVQEDDAKNKDFKWFFSSNQEIVKVE